MLIILVGLVGLIFGSFLAAGIERLHLRDGRFWLGRSRCLSCHKILAARDLIPLVSFWLLKGRCRFCQIKIPRVTLVLEILTSGVFILVAFFTRDLGILLWNLIFVTVLIFLAVYDFLYQEIPDEVSLPVICLVFLSSWLTFTPTPWASFGGLILGGGFLAVLILVSQGRWFGGGDLRFAALLGGALGPLGLLLAFFLASFSGTLVGLILIRLGRKKLNSQIPFGPFLGFGGLIALLFGKQFWNWYLLNFWVIT